MTCSTSWGVRYSRDRRSALVGFLGGLLTEKDAWEVAVMSPLSRVMSLDPILSLTEVRCFRCTKRPAGGLLGCQPFPQGPARCMVEAYVPRLMTSPSS